MNAEMNALGSPLKIGIQGVQASFHDVAARKYFSNMIEPIECSSFKQLCWALESDQADSCLMAIENSIAGSILTNYSLLENHPFKIMGEVYLRIEMSLLALPGDSIHQIQFVQSHPMALLQCADFLAQHPHIKVMEASDTAESAKVISENRMRGHAAIANALAGKVYGLNVLEHGIESNKMNYTRFLVICRAKDYSRPPHSNKTSICFETTHAPGSLLKVLEVFRDHDLNLTKLQSVPILGRPYEYSFHVDFEWKDLGRYEAGLKRVQGVVSKMVHFGDYPSGERPSL